MEADFARFYGLDFTDYYRGGLSLRRVYSLVRWLPPDAAVWVITEREKEAAKERQQVAEVETALALFR